MKPVGSERLQYPVLLFKIVVFIQGRSNAAKKAVLITDGPSNLNSYLTLPNAQQLRNIGTDVVAVGVGPNVDQTELQVSIYA